MCRSKEDGGLRCSAHTKQALARAAVKVEAAMVKLAQMQTPQEKSKATVALTKAQDNFNAKQEAFYGSRAGIKVLQDKVREARAAGDEESAQRYLYKAIDNARHRYVVLDNLRIRREEDAAVAAARLVQADWSDQQRQEHLVTTFLETSDWGIALDAVPTLNPDTAVLIIAKELFEYTIASSECSRLADDCRRRHPEVAAGLDARAKQFALPYDLGGFDPQGIHWITGTDRDENGLRCDRFDEEGRERHNGISYQEILESLS